MGAAVGHLACIATIIRICLKYGNLDILEDGYGINMLPLATFAMETYSSDSAACFQVKGTEGKRDSVIELEEKMHKAATVIQLKIERKLAKENPEFGMASRCLLEKIDYEKKQIEIVGTTYEILDTCFPTIDKEHPYDLSEDEKEVMEKLSAAFQNCEKLQKHIDFLLKQGSLYKVYNGNLLYHGCMPINEDGSLKKVRVYGNEYQGKALYDILEIYVRRAFFLLNTEEKKQGCGYYVVFVVRT